MLRRTWLLFARRFMRTRSRWLLMSPSLGRCLHKRRLKGRAHKIWLVLAMNIKHKLEAVVCASLLISTTVNLYLAFGRTPRSVVESPRIGQRLPSLDQASIVSGGWSRTALSKRRVYYWFSPTCPHCLENQISVEKLARSLPVGEFVGISQNDSVLKAYLEDQHIEFPVLGFPAGAPALKELGPTPTTFFVNAAGVIDKKWVGSYSDPIRREIERYFNVALPRVEPLVGPQTAVPVQTRPKY